MVSDMGTYMVSALVSDMVSDMGSVMFSDMVSDMVADMVSDMGFDMFADGASGMSSLREFLGGTVTSVTPENLVEPSFSFVSSVDVPRLVSIKFPDTCRISSGTSLVRECLGFTVTPVTPEDLVEPSLSVSSSIFLVFSISGPCACPR